MFAVPFELLVILLLLVPTFIVFYLGARKVGKNPILWGVIGGAACSMTLIILFPIAWDRTRCSQGDCSILFSYVAIACAISVAVAGVVYRKLLLKPPA